MKLFINSCPQLVELLFYVTSQIHIPVYIRPCLLSACLNNAAYHVAINADEYLLKRKRYDLEFLRKIIQIFDWTKTRVDSITLKAFWSNDLNKQYSFAYCAVFSHNPHFFVTDIRVRKKSFILLLFKKSKLELDSYNYIFCIKNIMYYGRLFCIIIDI